jgi:heat-inducible transcriptional repressor
MALARRAADEGLQKTPEFFPGPDAAVASMPPKLQMPQSFKCPKPSNVPRLASSQVDSHFLTCLALRLAMRKALEPRDNCLMPGRWVGALDYPNKSMRIDMSVLGMMNERPREIFRHIVESYLAFGEPVGSRHLSRLLPMALSPASIRNVMQDLEELGLIYAPHTSAGRLPTELGLRFFVDAMLEIGDIGNDERTKIEAQIKASAQDQTLETMLSDAMTLLSGLTRSAGVVVTTKENARLKHVEFVRLDPERALAVLVASDGSVENRIVPLPRGLPASALVEAGNYLNARISGRTIGEARAAIEQTRQMAEAELGELTARLVEAGLASWVDVAGQGQQLIVRGQANLLENLTALEDLERIRLLLSDLETQKDVVDLLNRAEGGEGVRIFIGSENNLFSLSGSSMIAAPFHDSEHRIVGVLGVIGPTRLNYSRIVPMVDYTSKLVGRVVQRG